MNRRFHAVVFEGQTSNSHRKWAVAFLTKGKPLGLPGSNFTVVLSTNLSEPPPDAKTAYRELLECVFFSDLSESEKRAANDAIVESESALNMV